VELKKILPIAVAIIIGGIIGSCKLDPWVAGDSPTNEVAISKTTRAFDQAKADEAVYKSQVGVVKISHKAHEEKGLKCEVCHHKKNNADREKKCAKCHTGEKGYKTMHDLCIGCHIERKEGPQKCKECH
jgi:hypothetical protein